MQPRPREPRLFHAVPSRLKHRTSPFSPMARLVSFLFVRFRFFPRVPACSRADTAKPWTGPEFRFRCGQNKTQHGILCRAFGPRQASVQVRPPTPTPLRPRWLRGGFRLNVAARARYTNAGDFPSPRVHFCAPQNTVPPPSPPRPPLQCWALPGTGCNGACTQH